jgi:hypothetical protein
VTRPFSCARLRRSPSFPRLTGVQVEIFDQMLKQLQGPWDKAQSRKAKPGRPWEVGGLEEHLLIMLLYYRCYVTQEFIGCFFGVDKSVICRTIQRVEELAGPLFGLKREPRIGEEEAIAIIVDCTEQPIYRPRDDDTQKLHYSGKKKRHTLKTEYMITEKGRMISGSPSHPGSHHDLAVRPPPSQGQAAPGRNCRTVSAFMGTAHIKGMTRSIPTSTIRTRGRKAAS